MRLRVVGGRAELAEGLGPALFCQRDRRGVHAGRGDDAERDSHVLGEQAEREAGAVAAGR